jgi:hypothetical protein
LKPLRLRAREEEDASSSDDSDSDDDDSAEASAEASRIERLRGFGGQAKVRSTAIKAATCSPRRETPKNNGANSNNLENVFFDIYRISTSVERSV